MITEKKDLLARIDEALDSIRPHLQTDGGKCRGDGCYRGLSC